MKNAIPFSIFGTVLQFSGRLVCLGVLAFAGLVAADNADLLAQRFKDTDETKLEGAAGDSIVSQLAMTGDSGSVGPTPDFASIGNGFWSFENSNLSIKRTRCTDKELKLSLAKLQNESTVAGVFQRPNFDASELVGLAKSTGAKSVELDSKTIWTSDTPMLQMRLVTTNSPEPALISAAVALRNANQWQLTIMKPCHIENEHLLPLPADSQVACQRHSDNGQLLMELVTVEEPSDSLIDYWRSRGWNVRHTPWGSENSFSYSCTRGHEFVYAWSASNAGSRTIVLSASSVPANSEFAMQQSKTNKQENDQ